MSAEFGIMQILEKGPIKRIHVNQHNLRQRISGNGTDPCYTIKHKGITFWAYQVEIMGPSSLIESINKPLGCGARLWIETNAELRIDCFHQTSASDYNE